MKIISIHVSPRQHSRLKNGHKVRVKHGKGVFVVVNPNNYNITSKAFRKNKGVELQLTPEELSENQGLTPELHQEYKNDAEEGVYDEDVEMEGMGLYKGAGIGKTFKQIGRTLKNITRPLVSNLIHTGIPTVAGIAGDMLGGPLGGVAGAMLGNVASNSVGKATGYGIHEQGKGIKHLGRKIKNTFRDIGRSQVYKQILKPVLKQVAQQGINELSGMASQYTGNNAIANSLIDNSANMARSQVAGMGLREQNLGTYEFNRHNQDLTDAIIRSQYHTHPIKTYWDDIGQPISRGTGLSSHHIRKHSRINDKNLIRGTGSLISQDRELPPALVSQAEGANFQFRFFLPPQYQHPEDFKNEGLIGGGLYA